MTQILRDKPWVLGVVVLAIAGATFGVWSLMSTEAHEWNGTEYEPPRNGIDFTLTDVEGEPMAIDALEGKVVLMYFGYTNCPDFCPDTLLDFRRVKQALGDQASDVAFVMVTVDPERDTPERMKEYLDFFDPSFIGLTGSEEELTPVKQEFGIVSIAREATPGPEVAYGVDHSTKVYVLNQDGELTLEYPFGTEPEAITEDVKYLLDS